MTDTLGLQFCLHHFNLWIWARHTPARDSVVLPQKVKLTLSYLDDFAFLAKRNPRFHKPFRTFGTCERKFLWLLPGELGGCDASCVQMKGRKISYFTFSLAASISP